MRKNEFMRVFIVAALLMLVAQSVYSANAIDTNKSRVEWLGTKVTGQHNGSLSLLNGEVDFAGRNIKSARFVFDMTSIKVLDIKDEKWNKKLEKHLKNKDFFGVEKHPTAIFELSSARPIRNVKKGEANYEFVGDLTIKGITHAVTFESEVDFSQSRARATGMITVDRTKYGIKYKSGKFFEDLGDRTIHDEFRITFDVVTR